MQASWQNSFVFRADFALAAGAYERNEPICFQGVAAAETIFLPEPATLRTIPGLGSAWVACSVSGAGRAGRSGEAPGALAFHSFSTVPGLLGPAEAGTLTWLWLGRAVVELGSQQLPAALKCGILNRQEKHCFAPRHDWVALVW